MRSAVEFRFYQRIVDELKVDWMPETYYTLPYGEKEPSFEVSQELLDAAVPFIGEVISDLNQRRLQSKVDSILHGHEVRREILIWSNERSSPLVIDGAKVVQSGPYGYAIRPFLDRTAIMAELLETIDLKE